MFVCCLFVRSFVCLLFCLFCLFVLLYILHQSAKPIPIRHALKGVLLLNNQEQSTTCQTNLYNAKCIQIYIQNTYKMYTKYNTFYTNLLRSYQSTKGFNIKQSTFNKHNNYYFPIYNNLHSISISTTKDLLRIY